MSTGQDLQPLEAIFERAIHDMDFRARLLSDNEQDQKSALTEAGVPADKLDQALGSLRTSRAALEEFGNHFGPPIQAA